MTRRWRPPAHGGCYRTDRSPDAALEHQRKYGSNDAHLTTLAYKNHKHSVNNPYAQLQKEIPFSVRTCLSASSSSSSCSVSSCEFVYVLFHAARSIFAHTSRRSSRMARVSSTAPSRYSRCAAPPLRRFLDTPLPSSLPSSQPGEGSKRALHVSPMLRGGVIYRPARRLTVRRPRSCAAKHS
jgi:hypothetical protein